MACYDLQCYVGALKMAAITYNGHTISHTLGKFSYTQDEKVMSISVDFLIKAATSGALETACDSAKEKLTAINKDFSMTFGGSTEFSMSHSSNTGYNARPTLSKVADELCTETSRHYNWSCVIGLPFSQSPYNYRREGSVAIAYMPSRQKQVAFNCLYTAGGSYSASANYNAYAKLWAVGILTSLGGVFELVSEHPSYDMEDKICSSSLLYKEIMANQSESSVDDTSFIDMQCTYSISVAQAYGRVISGGYQNAYPPVVVGLFFNTVLDRSIVATDAAFDTAYTTKIRPWLIKHAETVLGISGYRTGGTNYVLDNENKTYSVHNYSITGQLQILAYRDSNPVTSYDEILSINRTTGKQYKKLWNGKPHSYAFWNIGDTYTLNRVIIISRLNDIPGEPPDYGGNEFVTGAGTWEKLSSSTQYYQTELGSNTSATGLSSPIMHSKTFKDSYLYVEELNEQPVIATNGT